MAEYAVSFNKIPSQIRNPLVYVEVNPSQAGYFQNYNRAIIIAQSTNTIVETPVIIPSADWAKQQYGSGSQLAVMIENYFANNDFSELWALPLNDVSGATAAQWTITLSGAQTTAGTINLYIGSKLVYVPVGYGDTLNTIAQAIASVINSEKDLQVSASASNAVVTLTAKNKGTVSNSLKVLQNYRGALAGEKAIDGLTVVIAQSVQGATNPNIADKLPLIGDMDLTFYGHPYADTSSIAAFTQFLNHRWDPAQHNADGHAFTAVSGTLSELQTLGLALNDEHQTVVGYESTNITHVTEMVGAYLGVASLSLSIDPARTLQTLVLNGTVPTKEHDRFSLRNRGALLWSGIATLMYKNQSVQIERCITTYQLNSFGSRDNSYLDTTTLLSLSFIKKALTFRVETKFPRYKLAPDNTVFGIGQAIVTPSDVKGELMAFYGELVTQGICVKAERFAKDLIVAINPNDANRLDCKFPATIIGNLVVFAANVEFRLR